MDKEWIEGTIINEHMNERAAQRGLIFSPDRPPFEELAASIIAQAHEEELSGQCWDCDVVGALALARRELDTLRPQMVVMAEAMADVIECRGRGDAWAGERLRQALFAAPKVAWRGRARLLYSEEEPCFGVLPNQAFDLASGHIHEVIVLALAVAQESEQEE